MNRPESKEQAYLPRTLEPAATDESQEVLEYGRMDHTAVNLRFVEDLISAGPVGPRVIDLGCGTAVIPVLLCEKLDEIEILGVDSCVEMLEAAKIEVELGGMLGRVFLEQADCNVLEGFQDASANTVISNTVLHHVADPKQMLEQGKRLVAPGGRLFVRDLVRPRSAAAVEQLVELHGGNESPYGQQLLRQSLHAALTLQEIQQIVEQLGMNSSAVSMTSDRHWTIDWSNA